MPWVLSARRRGCLGRSDANMGREKGVGMKSLTGGVDLSLLRLFGRVGGMEEVRLEEDGARGTGRPRRE